MVLVVDTSVAVKWVVPESGEGIEHGTELALDLLAQGLTAPDCIHGEFANALYKKVRRGEIGEEQARQAVSLLPTLVGFLPVGLFVGPALELAFRLSHPVHDCVYLAVAIHMGIPMISADLKFVDKCRGYDLALPAFALGEDLPSGGATA